MHDTLHVYVYGFEESFGIGILPKGLTFQDFTAPKFNFWVPSSFVQWFVSNPNVKRKECFPIPHLINPPGCICILYISKLWAPKKQMVSFYKWGPGAHHFETHPYVQYTCYIYLGMPKQ